ncbi:DUF1192 domain-containing protein [Luteithermobacter gelatinilyticus]|uniref:DUF1192 domain-containing protein n=1 Tax=Luteithermobacter gelatinilyticus TaxID=2582913 RepID=UPI001106A1AA|nr:DUF1192 domain-containing protein [Luteithermobacter gelatinilyticus]|tara:strand:+ start:1673 stop:1867 length:195 start_codon:yes stop_codon:yes gene_type:complete
MEEEDLPRPKSLLAELCQEDLTPYSVAALENRVRLLQAELDRTRAAIGDKKGARSAAENIFKKT